MYPMEKTYSITDVRARLPELIREMHDSAEDIGITQQGRLTAILTPPDSVRESASSWLYLGAVAADLCPAMVCRAHERWTLVAPIRLWVHTGSGAVVSLGPTAPWHEPGMPCAYYTANVDSGPSMPIESLALPQWPGNDSTVYGRALDAAAEDLTRLLATTR